MSMIAMRNTVERVIDGYAYKQQNRVYSTNGVIMKTINICQVASIRNRTAKRVLSREMRELIKASVFGVMIILVFGAEGLIEHIL